MVEAGTCAGPRARDREQRKGGERGEDERSLEGEAHEGTIRANECLLVKQTRFSTLSLLWFARVPFRIFPAAIFPVTRAVFSQREELFPSAATNSFLGRRGIFLFHSSSETLFGKEETCFLMVPNSRLKRWHRVTICHEAKLSCAEDDEMVRIESDEAPFPTDVKYIRGMSASSIYLAILREFTFHPRVSSRFFAVARLFVIFICRICRKEKKGARTFTLFAIGQICKLRFDFLRFMDDSRYTNEGGTTLRDAKLPEVDTRVPPVVELIKNPGDLSRSYNENIIEYLRKTRGTIIFSVD